MNPARLPPFVAALALVGGTAFAHNLDTSYARFRVAADALETKFTYDLFTLTLIVPQLDANGDRQVTDAELQACVPAVTSYLQKHVQLEVNGLAGDLGEPLPVEFPPGMGDAIREQDFHAAGALVHFPFRKRLAAEPADFWVQFSLFDELGERHAVLGAIELDGNEQEVLFRSFEPDYLFDVAFARATRTGTVPATAPVAPQEASAAVASLPIESTAIAAAPPSHRTSDRSNTTVTPWRQFVGFFRLGVEHIFLGYDHILFLLSLIVVCRFTDLLKIVTSFTVAHSITLVLATLEAVQLPSQLVETSIAATIVYVAVENFWIKKTDGRWRLTFVFGLIHGFGFAGVLRELGLPADGLVRSLVAFNLGVEAGQLAIVAALFPLAAWAGRQPWGRKAQLTVSGAVALCGLAWFVDRAADLGWMPF